MQPASSRWPAARGGAWAALSLVMGFCGGVAGSPGRGVPVDLGLLGLSDESPLGADRLKAAGPLFERLEQAGGTCLLAWRPVFAERRDPEGHTVRREVLWPVFTSRSCDDEESWRFLTVFRRRSRAAGEEPPDGWLWAFPVFFTGAADGRRYAAVFPLAGELRNFFGRDRIAFVGFPLFSHSTRGDLQTWNFLWPVISWTRGARTQRVRVFPFYGRAQHRDGRIQQFVLWPVWNSVRGGPPGRETRGFILFPLVGHSRAGAQETWMVLPPLFRWSRGPAGSEANLPWPVLQFAKQEGTGEKRYVWPLWGRRTSPEQDSYFVLWPIVGGGRERRGPSTVRRFRVTPVFYSRSERRAADGGRPDAQAMQVKLWPLASYERAGTVSALRVPDLSPFPRLEPVDRNWAPLWSLFTEVRTPDERETEVLWGLFRWRRGAAAGSRLTLFPLFEHVRRPEPADALRWSVLGGLFGYAREGDARTVRVLFGLKLNLGE